MSSQNLIARVLGRLGIEPDAPANLETLRALYAAWCQQVPFDNVRKLIHLRTARAGALPGTSANDFLEAWLRHGTGGTCWSGSTGLHAVLASLGFQVERGIATMLAAPHLPPNHATLRVKLEDKHYLMDSAMLCGEPLLLSEVQETAVPHRSRGLTCAPQEGRWLIHWRLLHQPEGFDCRIESFGFGSDEYVQRHEETRGWSPFNYQVYARRNRGDEVLGLAFGQAVTLRADGGVESRPIDDAERQRILLEDFGMSEEILSQLPTDVPTPPPPGSQTAQQQEQAMASQA